MAKKKQIPGINKEGGHPRIPPLDWHSPPLKLSTIISIPNVHCTVTFHLHMWSQKPPETVSEVVNVKFFMGKHAPRPPSLGKLLHAKISPLCEKILY